MAVVRGAAARDRRLERVVLLQSPSQLAHDGDVTEVHRLRRGGEAEA